MNHSPSADEKLADHAGALADVLLNQLRAAQTDEGAICVMGDRTGKQGLSRSRRTVHQHLGEIEITRVRREEDRFQSAKRSQDAEAEAPLLLEAPAFVRRVLQCPGMLRSVSLS